MTRRGDVWLVSSRFDLLAFGAPALVALTLVPLGPWLAPTGETPLPFWVLTVVLVDVAHVWATLYLTYLDPVQRRRRPWLYACVPVGAYVAGALLAAWSWAAFWTVLAYTAVFHFVRQQYGWVALYHRRDPRLGRAERAFDVGAIYASTVFPLLWWHAHLPRRFHWFLPGDFIPGAAIAEVLTLLLWPVYVAALLGFALIQAQRASRDQPQWGKLIVVAGTALCWGVGIIVTDTDWAFTVTNVLIHGVPYMAVVWTYARRDASARPAAAWRRRMFLTKTGAVAFMASLALLAFIEEWSWDRLIWHGDTGLFAGPAVELGAWTFAVLPLLAVPQATHYVLDAFIWRRAFRR